MEPARVERLRRWHERAALELHARSDADVEYLGLHLHVPAGVFPPTPMSHLLGEAVIAAAGPGDRVLDMGTGSGVNAILAARSGADVVAVDVNPAAVEAARANADAAGVGDRVEVVEADLFAAIDDRFDVVVFDPPFRWFTPADMAERAITDDGYDTLRRFFEQVVDHLRPGGRVLLSFGSTGDVAYLHELAQRAGLEVAELASASLERDGQVETYWAFRLTVDEPGLRG